MWYITDSQSLGFQVKARKTFHVVLFGPELLRKPLSIEFARQHIFVTKVVMPTQRAFAGFALLLAWCMLSNTSAVKRIRHTQNSRGQILALAFK